MREMPSKNRAHGLRSCGPQLRLQRSEFTMVQLRAEKSNHHRGTEALRACSIFKSVNSSLRKSAITQFPICNCCAPRLCASAVKIYLPVTKLATATGISFVYGI